MSNEELIKAYLTHKSYNGAALSLGIPRHKIYPRIHRLRKAGVNIPSFSRTRLDQTEIDKLNDLVRNFR